MTKHKAGRGLNTRNWNKSLCQVPLGTVIPSFQLPVCAIEANNSLFFFKITLPIIAFLIEQVRRFSFGGEGVMGYVLDVICNVCLSENMRDKGTWPKPANQRTPLAGPSATGHFCPFLVSVLLLSETVSLSLTELFGS